MSSTEEVDVVVVGAGAAGIGTSVALSMLDLDVRIIERDEIGASFRQWPDEMRFITPSFPSNSFGLTDLNAVTPDTSPAFTLDREHPTGDEYADYLEGVVDFYELSVETGLTVTDIRSQADTAPDLPPAAVDGGTVETPSGDAGFTIETSEGLFESEYVVWAAGQFGSPRTDRIAGSEHCLHTSAVDSWREHAESSAADEFLVIGGYESGVVVSFWDKVDERTETRRALERLSADIGVPVVPVDARKIDWPMTDGGTPTAGTDSGKTADEYSRIMNALAQPGVFSGAATERFGRRIEPPKTVFEWPIVGPIVSLLLLLVPAGAAVWFANTLAGELSPIVEAAFEPLVATAERLPEPLAVLLTNDYGLLSMGPFLFVWAGPTMLIFAVILGVYKNTGLVTRMTVSLHPLMRRVGLSGRDLIRVVMGFGCNVPAVVNTRSCSDCTRCTTISAISFGSACSYQFPATLAVFAAVGMGWLVGPYLFVLAVTTFIYVGLIAPAEARQSTTVVDRRTFLQWPDPKAVAREAWTALREFFAKALPVFVVITFVAAILDRLGVIDTLGAVLGPAMGLFNLPSEAALTVVLASIRKDGIALLTADGASTAAALSPVQVLVVVYLAGVLLPCLVTAFTVAREVSSRWALTMMARQAAVAVGFAVVIAWGGALIFG